MGVLPKWLTRQRYLKAKQASFIFCPQWQAESSVRCQSHCLQSPIELSLQLKGTRQGPPARPRAHLTTPWSTCLPQGLPACSKTPPQSPPSLPTAPRPGSPSQGLPVCPRFPTPWPSCPPYGPSAHLRALLPSPGPACPPQGCSFAPVRCLGPPSSSRKTGMWFAQPDKLPGDSQGPCWRPQAPRWLHAEEVQSVSSPTYRPGPALGPLQEPAFLDLANGLLLINGRRNPSLPPYIMTQGERKRSETSGPFIYFYDRITV